VFSHARRLSWSGETLGYTINIAAIGGEEVDLGIEGGNELIDLVDAFFAGDESQQESARKAVIEVLGPESFFDSATVFGNFEMMNRIAEGTGIGIPPQWIERHAEMVETLHLTDAMKSQQT